MITIVWAVGLLAVIGALLYMAAYRRKFWWVEGGLLDVPRALAPLYLALTIFAVGLALLSFRTDEAISLWVAAIWSSLALLFGQQLASSILAGLQAGWDTQMTPPAEEGETPARSIPVWWIVAAVLLLLNAGLVGYSAITRWQQGTFYVDLRTILTLPSLNPTPSGVVLPPSATGALSSVETITHTVTPTPIETPPQETPTPVMFALPSPTPSPTPAPVLPTVTISAVGGANARALPALDGEVLTIIPQGEAVAALGRNEDASWIQIRMSDGRAAWVAASVVTLNVEDGSLPIIPVN